MNVCLINPPLVDDVSPFFEAPYPPQSLLYLGAWLEKRGHAVKVVDCMLEGLDHKQLGDRLQQLQPDVVGITMTSAVRHSGLQCAKVAKAVNSNVLTVVGGPHVSFLDEEILKHCTAVDVVVRGEGEITLAELLDASSWEQVLGITYRDGDIIHRTADRPNIRPLDSLPMPAFHLVPTERYFPYARRYQNHLRHPATAISTARGCVGKCTFCSTPGMWHGVRIHSPEYIVEEIAYLHQRYGIRDLRIFDDTFPSSCRWLEQFAELLRERSIYITYRCLSRVTNMDEDTVRLLKETGCYFIQFGIESGSQKTLSTIQKGITVEQVQEAVQRVKRLGIDVGGFFMVGFPGESKADMYQTLCLVRSLPFSFAYCVNTLLFPASQLCQDAHLDPEIWFREDVKSVPAFQHEVYSHNELEVVARYVTYAALWANFWRVLRFSWRTVSRPKLVVLFTVVRELFYAASMVNHFPFHDFERQPHRWADKLLGVPYNGLRRLYRVIRSKT